MDTALPCPLPIPAVGCRYDVIAPHLRLTYFSLGSGSWRGYPSSLHPNASVWAKVYTTAIGQGETNARWERQRQSSGGNLATTGGRHIGFI